jgi:hypothetical protein
MSEDIFGRPGARDLDRQRQYIQPKSFAMPLDDGCWLHQHHCVQGPRPDPVEPHPEQPICGENLNPAFARTVVDMITMISAFVSLLSFRFRSRAGLELELVALRHQRSHKTL